MRLHSARAALALVVTSLSFGCGHPTAPTPVPPPSAAPVISCPAPERVSTPLNVPVNVVYGAATVTGGTSPVTVSCTPASGSVFPIGVTPVTCTATDAQNRVSSCTTSVTVVASLRLSATRFAAFGDSITAGEDGNVGTLASPWERTSPILSIILVGSEYPRVLQGLLQSRYTSQAGSIIVANTGVPGERAGDPDTLARFTRTILGGGYQSVLLMEGANDLYDAYYGDKGATQAALDNLRTMARQARIAGMKPYLATIPPQNPNAPCVPSCRNYAAALVPGYNDSLRNVAASEGVPLVDVYQAFGGDLTLLATDGLHPNAAGFQRIADTFFLAIKSTLE